jgi:hypothetical protein
VEVRIAGTNIVLDRSPLTFPVAVRSAEWSDRGAWRTVG